MSAPAIGTMRVTVTGVGIAACGLAGWAQTRSVLDGRTAYEPAPLVAPSVKALPPAERRRAGAYARLAMGVAQEAVAAAGADARSVASVFASADGDSENLHQICVALAGAAPEISPTRFHNSVQNALSGYWSIAMQARAPTTTVNGGDHVFATALLEAAAQVVCEGRSVLVVACDLPMPAPLYALHPMPEAAAVALVLTPAASLGVALAAAGDSARAPIAASETGDRVSLPFATLELALIAASAAPETAAGSPALEALRSTSPALRALPLLAALAAAEPAQVVLALDASHSLQVRLVPGDPASADTSRAAA
jgi:hypothetical protein